MIGASDEQLDVFNEVWYTMLLNTGEAAKGTTFTHCHFSEFHSNIFLLVTVFICQQSK